MQKTFLIFLLLIGSLAAAQEKTFTLREISNNSSLYPQRPAQLKWVDSRYFSYIDSSGEKLYRVLAKTSEKSLLIDLPSLKKMIPDSLAALTRFPELHWQDGSSFSFLHDGYLFSFRNGVDTLRWEARYDSETQAREISDNNHMAYVKDYNLYIWKNRTKKAIAVSHDGSRELQYGLAASRYEFGIRKGLFWSPDGQKLAFYRIDQSHVSDYPLTDYHKVPAAPVPVKYPMNGDSSEHVDIGIYDVSSGRLVYLESKGPYDQYLTNITWSPGGNYLYVAVVNREQNEMQLQQFDARSGIFIKTLFTEKNEKYVEPEHGPRFLKKSPDKFIWFSERDGHQHLYLYNTSGQLLAQLTKGPFEVTRIIGLDAAEHYLYYQSTESSPLNRQVYRLDLRNGEKTALSSGDGFHDALLSPTGYYLLETFEGPETPWQITLYRSAKKLKELPFRYAAPDPLAGYSLGKTDILTLKADDGTPLYARLIKPADFDPAKKYPVMVYVYGGPHVQLVRNSWLYGAQLFLHYMSQQGYIVFTLDNRGSANRGLEFEQAIFRQMGTLEIEDQEAGVEYLKSLPYVDAERMAVFGWSYGGYMSTSLMLRKPGLFQVGVAGGPVCNWRYYEVMYGERYMDRYFENQEGFEKSRLANYAKDLEGSLLVIHGLQDATVVPQHSMELMNAFIEARKVVHFFAYPDHPHNVRGPDREHLYRIIEDFINTQLNIHH